MYSTTEKGRQINAFIHVEIPRPADIFKRLGMRRINSSFTSSKGNIGDVAAPSDNSVIGVIIAGEREARRMKEQSTSSTTSARK